jgi:hypothetical protein
MSNRIDRLKQYLRSAHARKANNDLSVFGILFCIAMGAYSIKELYHCFLTGSIHYVGRFYPHTEYELMYSKHQFAVSILVLINIISFLMFFIGGIGLLFMKLFFYKKSVS